MAVTAQPEVPVLGVGPWKQQLRPYQVEAGRAILDSVVRGRGLSFSVEVARQGGKNELSAQLEVLLLMPNRMRDVDAVKCSPTYQPQGRISLRRLWSRVLEAGLEPIASREGGHVVRVGRARMVFLSAEPEANVVGHSAQLLLEVDEAQDVKEEKFDREFRPMAATTNATTVFYGTAWDDSTLLERAKQRHLELERRDGVRRHFEYDWEVVARYNPAYGRYVEAERERLGEDHPLFLTQYCLKPIAGGGRLFVAGQLAQLQGRHARQRAPGRGESYVAGLDLAGGVIDEEAGAASSANRDATVLTIARVLYPARDALVQEPRLEVVEQYTWTGEPHDALLRRLADLLREVWQVRRLAVDATGLGETLARLLLLARPVIEIDPDFVSQVNVGGHAADGTLTLDDTPFPIHGDGIKADGVLPIAGLADAGQQITGPSGSASDLGPGPDQQAAALSQSEQGARYGWLLWTGAALLIAGLALGAALRVRARRS